MHRDRKRERGGGGREREEGAGGEMAIDTDRRTAMEV